MKRLHCGKKLNRFFHRCINGTKGVISLFLAILMVPFVSIAGALINAARVNSAIASDCWPWLRIRLRAGAATVLKI